MRGTASAVQRRPMSLMQRLALITGTEDRDPARSRTAYEPSVGGYFGIGLVSGGMAGAVALACFPMFGPALWAPRQAETPPAIAALAAWTSPARKTTTLPVAPVATVSPEAQPDAFDMVIDRSARASAPFGLQLVGSRDGGMEVLLHDVPRGVVPSRGEQRGASTWALKAADLAGLHLALDDGAPEVFNVRIEVRTPAGVVASPGIARVRLIGAPPAEQTAAATVPPAPLLVPAVNTEPAAVNVAPHPAVTHGRGHAPKAKERVARVAPPAGTTVVEIERRSPPPVAQEPETRHFPEGASALGAIIRNESDRQVWWKLPAPTWSPFLEAAGR